MTVDYKYVNGTQVAVICDLENANLTVEEWRQFGNMVIQRFEDMLPTVTIVGVEHHVLKRIIESKCKDALLAHAIVGRLWEMGVKKIDYLPTSAQPQVVDNPTEKAKQEAPKSNSRAKDFYVNGGRGYGSKVVQH